MGGGGKSGGASQAYDYYGTLAGGVSIGLNEDLVAIILDGNEVWPKGTAWSVGLACTAGQLYVFDAQTWTCTTNHVASGANAPGSGLEGWTEYVFTRGSENYDDFSLTASDGTFYGVLRFYWGTNAQTVDSLLQSTGNDGGRVGNLGSGDQHPDYEGICYVVIRDFLLGQQVQSGPNIEIITRRKPNQFIITDSAAGIVDGQANLAAVAAEWLTDTNCLGLPATMVDTTSFVAVADYLQSNQSLYGSSVLIDTSESVTSLFDKLVQMFDGYIRFNPATQKIELGVYQHGVVPTGGTYVTLTADSFTKFPKFNSQSWQETTSRATVRFNDRQLNYQQTSLQVDDPRAFFILGGVREQSLDRAWIARQMQAQAHGRETLRVIGHAQMTGELEVRREIGRTIRAGDYVLVDIDLEPNANTIYQFFRVTSRKIPPFGPITLNVFADNTLAAVPWNGSATPVIAATPPVPPITSFRFLEVPTILSGSRGEIICLAQRPSNLLVGAQLYFDIASGGTFSSMLGQFNNYAAKATLYANVAAGDTTLQLTVDTTQVDANYFTLQYSSSQAADDTMLAFIVSLVPSGGDAGQVAETGGYQLLEICSVSAQTLISAGRYNLTVLRGRQNTAATAFTTANTEVWLIPQALLNFFNHTEFDQIRANRLASLTPAYAQFRICPFTFVNTLPLSSAASEQFRFPLNSITAPSLVLTAPSAFAMTYTPTAFPLTFTVAGTWSDPDSNLVEYQVLLRLSTDIADRVIEDQIFSPVGSQPFSTTVQIDQPGSWIVKLIARTANNLVTERDITVTVSSGSGPVCAGVQVIGSDGIKLFGGRFLKGVGFLTGSTPFGPLTLRCSTPSATVYFQTAGLIQRGGLLLYDATPQVFSGAANQPFHGLLKAPAGTTTPPASYSISFWATAAGFANSPVNTFTLRLFI